MKIIIIIINNNKNNNKSKIKKIKKILLCMNMKKIVKLNKWLFKIMI